MILYTLGAWYNDKKHNQIIVWYTLHNACILNSEYKSNYTYVL